MGLKTLVKKLILITPIQYLPVIVRKGAAKGARWTLFPCSAYWRGDTEKEIEFAIRKYGATPGTSCWDLGAHFGIYTVGMAMAVGPEGQITGIEPNPFSFKRCLLHVRLNNLDWVKLFNAASSDSKGTAILAVGNDMYCTSSHLPYSNEEIQTPTKNIEVNTIILDDLVKSKEIRAPQFIKIDVEGHGAEAIKGAIQTISLHKPVIVMSFHSTEELVGARCLLEPLGYRPYSCSNEEPKIAWETRMPFNAIIRC